MIGYIVLAVVVIGAAISAISEMRDYKYPDFGNRNMVCMYCGKENCGCGASQ